MIKIIVCISTILMTVGPIQYSVHLDLIGFLWLFIGFSALTVEAFYGVKR